MHKTLIHCVQTAALAACRWGRRALGSLSERRAGRRTSVLPSTWEELAFRRFIPGDGNRAALLDAIAAYARDVRTAFEAWRDCPDQAPALADALLTASARIDDGKVWHQDLKLRSYVDVSIQVAALRNFVEYLVSLAAGPSPLELTGLLLEHQPSARAALLVHADLLLEAQDASGAITAIERALRVQATCTTAQQRLFRAHRLQRDRGESSLTPPALDYDLRDKFCHFPFTYLSTGFQGNAFVCSCPAWVPFPIGNLLEAESAEVVWNSDTAAEIRRSVLDGDFSYCSRTLCSYITSQSLPTKSEVTEPDLRAHIDGHQTKVAEQPVWVSLNHDPSCNLACPSCRTGFLKATPEQQSSYAQATQRVILPLLKRVDGYTYITGGGEPFSSKHFREILRALNREEYPGLRVYLITNGQLLTAQCWSDFPNLSEMLLIVSVSVDAAHAETYERLRRPGKWAPLMQNLELLAQMRRARRIPKLGLNFVVQQDNFREILEFIALADRLCADVVWFQRMTNYGSYDEATFRTLDVTHPSHPDHAELLEMLRHPWLQRPFVDTDMLRSLLPERVGGGEPLAYVLSKRRFRERTLEA